MKELKVLLRFMKPYRLHLFIATLSMVMVTAMNMAGPWMIRNLIGTVTDSAGGGVDIQRVNFLALALVIIYLLRAVSGLGPIMYPTMRRGKYWRK